MDGGHGLRKEFEEVIVKSNYFDRNEKWLILTMVMEIVLMIGNDDW